MRTKAKSESLDQLDLFQPPPLRPTWSTLPDQVKAEVRELVAQMLRQHVEASSGHAAEEVEND